MKERIQLATNSYGKWKVPKDFTPGREVLIGFSRKNGHAYLIAGKYEIHGHFIFKKTFFREFCEKSCEPLIFIRFKDISPSDLLEIESLIERSEGIRESSCINYCLITIFTALGIRIESEGRNIVNLEDCLLSILEFGASRNGKRQVVEIYKAVDWDLRQILNHFNLLEKRFEGTHLISRFLGRVFFFHRKSHRLFYQRIKNHYSLPLLRIDQ